YSPWQSRNDRRRRVVGLYYAAPPSSKTVPDGNLAVFFPDRIGVAERLDLSHLLVGSSSQRRIHYIVPSCWRCRALVDPPYEAKRCVTGYAMASVYCFSHSFCNLRNPVFYQCLGSGNERRRHNLSPRFRSPLVE